MAVTLYSFKLKRELPLLSDEEYRPISQALAQRMKRIQEYLNAHGVTLDEARQSSGDAELNYYERLTGIRLEHPEQLYAVRLSDYGRPCSNCGKPFRTPSAKICAECGLELPEGTTSGAASPVEY